MQQHETQCVPELGGCLQWQCDKQALDGMHLLSVALIAACSKQQWPHVRHAGQVSRLLEAAAQADPKALKRSSITAGASPVSLRPCPFPTGRHHSSRLPDKGSAATDRHMHAYLILGCLPHQALRVCESHI